jgi:hypothetical protein
MSARVHASTDDVDPAVCGAGLRPPISAAPSPSRGSSDAADSFEGDATEVNPRQHPAAVEQPTPTEIDPSASSQTAMPIAGEPVRMISMKDHSEGQRPKLEPRVPLHVQLRSLAEVSGSHEVQRGLGQLALPRNPAQKRERGVGDDVVRACMALLLAGTIALAIWLVFGR